MERLLLTFPFFFYLLLPSRNFYWDGVAFAISIEKGPPLSELVHPNHLGYTVLSLWFYQLSHAVGLPARALFLMQGVNAVLAGLAVFLIHQALRLRGLPSSVRVPAALAFGFSATWWRFASDANPYIPSIFFLLLTYIVLQRKATSVAGGLAHTIAMIFHQLGILFVAFAVLLLRRSSKGLPAYLAMALIPVGTAYLLAYSTVARYFSVGGFWSWTTSHSDDSGFSFDPLRSLGFTVRGTFRLFFGGKARDFVGDWISWAALAGLTIATIFLVVLVVRAMRSGARLSPAPRELWVWVGVYVAFLFVWMPQNTFYRMFYLVPLVMIVATMLQTFRHVLWPVTAVLFCWNFAFVAYPQSRPAFNETLQFAMAQQERWQPGSAIVFSTFHPDLWTISYFNQQAAWIENRGDLAQLEKTLAYTRQENRALWLEETGYLEIAKHANGRQWLAEHERAAESVTFKSAKHDFRFHCIR